MQRPDLHRVVLLNTFPSLWPRCSCSTDTYQRTDGAPLPAAATRLQTRWKAPDRASSSQRAAIKKRCLRVKHQPRPAEFLSFLSASCGHALCIETPAFRSCFYDPRSKVRQTEDVLEGHAVHGCILLKNVFAFLGDRCFHPNTLRFEMFQNTHLLLRKRGSSREQQLLFTFSLHLFTQTATVALASFFRFNSFEIFIKYSRKLESGGPTLQRKAS